MGPGARKFALQQIDRSQAPELKAGQATVTAISGASPPVVTVTYLGGTDQFPYLPSYTPVVGHVVAVIPYAGSQLILGRPIGHP